MRLEKIEIKGFKSFADKTVLHFDSNVTGIVGPNGCGKSNVVDAIRWVLGEQKTKALRLEKMDNIIFNGTKERKQSQFAEVSITLENTKNLLPTEYNQVTITRAVDRDGSSDYKINGVACRLKDIRDLFLDTGISTDTYAIIELKMIDEILNDTEDARRRLFEQAAGISKFKTRKRETLLKLENTQADLNRIDDLLFEIANNLKSLELQARKANRYKKLKEEYKELSLQLAYQDVSKLKNSHHQITEQITLLEDKKTAKETEISVKEAELQKEKLLILEGEKTLSTQQKEINNLIAEIQENEGDKKVKQQRKIYLLEKLNAIYLQNENYKKESATLATNAEDLNLKISSKSITLSHLITSLNELKIEKESLFSTNQDKKKIIENLRNTFQKIRIELNEAEKNYSVRKAGYESLKTSSQRSLFEKQERLNDLESLEKEILELDGKIKIQFDKVNQLVAKEEKAKLEAGQLQEQIESLRLNSNEVNRKIDAKTNEYKLTKNMIDSLEGFPESIKYLKKNATWLNDIPLLSDIIYCDEKYRVAIENLLQPYLNHYIVQDENTATKSLNLLTQSNVGRASFFILDYFKNRPYKNINKNFNLHSLRYVYQLVETSKEYQPVLNYLLQDCYLASDKKEVELFIEANPNFDGYIITEEGNYTFTPYERNGGAIGLFEGKKLGRVKNLEKIQETLEKLQKESKVFEDKIKELQTHLIVIKNTSYSKEIEAEKRILRDIENQHITKKTKVESFKDLINKIQQQYDASQNSLTEIEKEIKALESKQNVLSQEFTNAKNELENAESEQLKYNDNYSSIAEKYNLQNIEHIKTDNELKSLQQQLQFNQNRNEQLHILLNKNETDEKNTLTEQQQLAKQITELEKSLEAKYLKRDELKQKLSSQETDFFKLREQTDKLENEIKILSREGDKIREEITLSKEKYNEVKVDLNNIKNRFSIEFNVDIENIETTEIDTIKSKYEKINLQEETEKVRNRITNFGEVNPMAEEAYEEMKERHDFISTQKNDLLKAKDDLMDTIKQIETTAQERFMETFNAVRENFIHVFRSMFTEDDNCDLVLEKPDNPLESKIDIIAKPKGKRPQSVSQLSGGEKTLTSLSLLFGLYLYKPAPFCILDEVDAPLDDANIQKFNKAIRNFSENSQFIIVTHNKQTMESVDIIYGVTMPQKGISQLVPVDFRSLQSVT